MRTFNVVIERDPDTGFTSAQCRDGPVHIAKRQASMNSKQIFTK